MTDLQIRYFLTAARCLNFTEAAKQLYISQSALSQQIAALELELNMQLFILMKKRLYLTPAAAVLMRELPGYEKHYAQILEQAKIANQGILKTVKLGLMEGQTMPEAWLKRFFAFRRQHPETGMEISCFSLGALNAALQEGTIDVAYLPDFEVEGKERLVSLEVAADHGVAIVSKFHPLANQTVTSLRQLQHETLLMLRESESTILHEFILNDCKRAGFVPNIQYVASLDENIACTELGIGVGITNWDSYACWNPNIRVLDGLKIAERRFVLAWRRDNFNCAIPLFVHAVCP